MDPSALSQNKEFLPLTKVLTRLQRLAIMGQHHLSNVPTFWCLVGLAAKGKKMWADNMEKDLFKKVMCGIHITSKKDESYS